MAEGYSLKKSNAHFQKAEKRLPVGVSSNYRYWGAEDTLYISHGKGARLWDIDGNEYIDYRIGYGPAILGYADERVDAAAQEGMKVGGPTALSTEYEWSVAGTTAASQLTECPLRSQACGALLRLKM